MKRKLEYEEPEFGSKRKCMKENSSGVENIKLQDFEPVHFLRCHSKKNDAADVQTQVWQCAFDPNVQEGGKQRLVATCGGNSVCFIDVKSGKVKGKYYSEDIRDLFFTLTWTTVCSSAVHSAAQQESIVAVGGTLCCIHLLHPRKGLVFCKHTLRKKRKQGIVISSLLFHPEQSSVLFCAESNGSITAFDIGCPLPPQYKTKFVELYVISSESEIFSLAFSVETDVLLAACGDGLFGWNISNEDKNKRPTQLQFRLPSPPEGSSQPGSQLVDSVETLEKGLVATKCALHGNIYVWNLKNVLWNADKKTTFFNVSPTHVLKWSDTDNYFMYMGYNKGLLGCGDDKGALWLYDATSFLSAELPTRKPLAVNPSVILPWPDVVDSYVDKERKLRLDVYDIVVDKVVIDRSAKYIVAVTSNNMVCIWKRLRA